MLVSKSVQLCQKILQFNYLLFYNDYLKVSRVLPQNFSLLVIHCSQSQDYNVFWVESNNITSTQRLFLKGKPLLTHTIQDKTVWRLALSRQTDKVHTQQVWHSPTLDTTYSTSSNCEWTSEITPLWGRKFITGVNTKLLPKTRNYTVKSQLYRKKVIH